MPASPHAATNVLSHPRRRAGRRAALLLLLGATSLAAPSTAAAHGALKRSSPKAGAVLDTIPRVLRLEFSERLDLRLTKVVLTGPGGGAIALGALTWGDQKQMVVLAAPTKELPPGSYEVRWQTAGADGHPTRGRFGFTIRPNAVRAGAPPAPPAASATTFGDAAPTATADPATAPGHMQPEAADESLFDERSRVYVAIRWLQYVVAFLVVGAFVFVRLVLARAVPAADGSASLAAAARRRSLRIGLVASAALLAVQAARFIAQRTALRGGGDFVMDVSAADMLVGSPWGAGLLLIVFGSCLAFVEYRRALATATEGSVTFTVALVSIAVGMGLSGHQAASPVGAPLGVGIDAAHILGTAGWLGTLAILVMTALPMASTLEGLDHAQVAAILRVFSPLVLVAAGVAGATGVTLAAVNLGSIAALWQSGYGQVLMAKLAVLSVVAGTGAYNWRRVLPSLGTQKATQALRRSASVEAIVAVVVVALTSLLVATPTPAMR